MHASLRRLVLPGFATLIAFAMLMSLGFWQVARLQWKENLIATVEARLNAPPIPAPPPSEWPDLEKAGLEYQPVTVTGRFLHQQEAHVFVALSSPKGQFGGMGYLVMTPLVTDDGWYVYVNRGFVPEDRKVPATRAAGQLDGNVTVTGLYRAPSGRSWFSASDDPRRNVWFSRDPWRFAEVARLPTVAVAPYIIDAFHDPSPPGGLPQGGETLVQFPNNHLGYAITWFGLALGLVAVFVAFARTRLRE